MKRKKGSENYAILKLAKTLGCFTLTLDIATAIGAAGLLIGAGYLIGKAVKLCVQKA